LNGFIDTAVNVGRGFSIFLLMLLFLAMIGYALNLIRHSDSSTDDMIGGCIMFCVIVFPAATIGAFLGNQIAVTLSLPVGDGLAWLGLLGGTVFGFYLWRWIGTRQQFAN
jgi:hypothetical protein